MYYVWAISIILLMALVAISPRCNQVTSGTSSVDYENTAFHNCQVTEYPTKFIITCDILKQTE